MLVLFLYFVDRLGLISDPSAQILLTNRIKIER